MIFRLLRLVLFIPPGIMVYDAVRLTQEAMKIRAATGAFGGLVPWMALFDLTAVVMVAYTVWYYMRMTK